MIQPPDSQAWRSVIPGAEAGDTCDAAPALLVDETSDVAAADGMDPSPRTTAAPAENSRTAKQKCSHPRRLPVCFT